MPKPNQSGRKRFFYNQNIKRDKSGDKYKNLIDHTIILVRRLEKEGMTKWLADAFNKAQAKIKSYGITFAQVSQALDHKGLSQLKDLLAENIVFVQKKGNNVSIVKKKATVLVDSPILVAGEKTVTPKKTVTKKAVEKKESAPKKTTKATTEKKVATTKKATTEKKTTTRKTTKKEA